MPAQAKPNVQQFFDTAENIFVFTGQCQGVNVVERLFKVPTLS